MLTEKRLKELFEYNPDSGEFTRLKTAGNIKKGTIVSSKNSSGYIQVQIDGKPYRAHRLAILYMEGSLPDPKLDVHHKDNNRANNAYSNLEVISHAQNQREKSTYTSNVNITYIRFRPRCKRPCVQVGKKFGEKWLGFFDSIEDAVDALKEFFISVNAYQELERLEIEYSDYLKRKL